VWENFHKPGPTMQRRVDLIIMLNP